jgi:hypothetical protein
VIRLCVVAAVMLASADASAGCPKCECMSYLAALHTPEEPRDVALNARVIAGTVPDPARSEHFVLRPVGGQPIAVTSTPLHLGTHDTLVLTPTAPLAANTEYDLVMLRGENAVPYAKFVTSEGIDATAPTWTGDLVGTFVPADTCRVDCNERRGARVEITAPIPADDRSGAELVEVWVTSGARIDYTKPATANVLVNADEGTGDIALGAVAPHVTIVVGGAGPCKQQSIALPRGATQVRIGMKVIDRAGNASEPRELDVKLVAPRSK